MVFGVTIGIVVKDQAKNIRQCLLSLPQQSSYPIELMIVDHCSSDNTLESIFSNVPKHIELRLFQNRENNLGNSRDFILRNAKYSILCFIDSDCEATPGWPDSLLIPFLEARKHRMVLGVGGENTPPNSASHFYSALRIMCSSPLGNGNSSQAKPILRAEEVFHVPTCNLLIDVNEAKKVGGFSSDFTFVCEDLEFSRRAQALGYFFLFVPNAKVYHWHEESYFRWAKKMFRYGRGQILVQRVHKNHLMGPRIFPLLFLAILLITALFQTQFLLTIVLFYASVIVLTSAYLSRKERPWIPSLVRIAFLFFCTHLAYGVGELFELLKINGKVKNAKMAGEVQNHRFLLVNRRTESDELLSDA